MNAAVSQMLYKSIQSAVSVAWYLKPTVQVNTNKLFLQFSLVVTGSPNLASNWTIEG